MRYITILFLVTLICPDKTFCQSQKLFFDPSTATGVPESVIFEEMKFIPLETKRESLFGKISQLIVTDKYFVILDNDTKAVYFFYKNGKYAKKFRFRGYDLKSMLFDKNKNALLITGINKNYSPFQKDVQAMLDDPVNNRSIKYTKAIYYFLSDTKDGHTEAVQDFDLGLANPFYFGTHHWVYSFIYANKAWKDTVDYELKVSDGHRIIRSYFPYNRKTSSIFYGKPAGISFYGTDDSARLLFTRPFEYKIYELTTDTVRELYNIILPAANTIPQSFYTQDFASRSSLEDYKMKHTGFAWGVDNVIDMNRYLFFSLDFFRNFRGRNFVFDKKTIQFFNQNRITSDSSNYFLPVVRSNIEAYDKTYLYTSVPSSVMFQMKKNNEKRNVKYSVELQNYFKNGNQEDNPVIIMMKPKTGK